MGTLTALISGIVTLERIWSVSLLNEKTWIHHMIARHLGALTFLIMDTLILISAATLLTVQIYQISRNITTNEQSNAIRYAYLRSPDGRFRNPYNHGCFKNCSDFLIRGYTDDEVA
jgi:palmitoyltransferase